MIEDLKVRFKNLFIAEMFVLDLMKDQTLLDKLNDWFTQMPNPLQQPYEQIEKRQRELTTAISLDTARPNLYSINDLSRVVDFTNNLKKYKGAILIYARANFCVGSQQRTSGDNIAAMEAYQQAIDADPGLINAQLALADLKFDSGDFMEAAKIFKSIHMVNKAMKCYQKIIAQFGDADEDENTSTAKFDMLIDFAKRLAEWGLYEQATTFMFRAEKISVYLYADGQGEQFIKTVKQVLHDIEE